MAEKTQGHVMATEDEKTYFIGVYRWPTDIEWQSDAQMHSTYDQANWALHNLTAGMEGTQKRVVQFDLPLAK